MRKNISPENALHRAAALCSRSEQAEADIRKKLTSWGIVPGDAEKIISRLIEEKYLDEMRYAHAFVRDKFRFGGWGRIKIAYAMRQKHISADCIADALTEIDETEYFNSLLHALKSKLLAIAGKEPFQQRAALFRFAASRGFEPQTIGKAISSIMKISNCDDDSDLYQEDNF